MDPVFRSKIDLWLIALIVGIPLMLLEFVLDGSGLEDSFVDLLAVVVLVIASIFFICLYFTTSYLITAEALLVKSGPFSWVVPLREISTIEPTRRPAPGPALSLDRLLISYGGDSELIVSPADKAGFMTALKRHLNAARKHS